MLYKKSLYFGWGVGNNIGNQAALKVIDQIF